MSQIPTGERSPNNDYGGACYVHSSGDVYDIDATDVDRSYGLRSRLVPSVHIV